MTKYVKPSIEITVLETNDIVTNSRIIDNGQATHEDENGNVYTGKKGTFYGLFGNIW